MPVNEVERLRRIAKQVESHRALVKSRGCSFQSVDSSHSFPCFTYTIGLHSTYQHPELITVGIGAIPQAVDLLYTISELIRKGSRFDADMADMIVPAGVITENYPAAFRKVHSGYIPELLGMACRVYRHQSFSAVQLVWPDASGVFPFQPGFDEEYRRQQPLLDVLAARAA